MKKISFTLFAVVLFITVKAQKIVPQIKEGTELHCTAYVQGQEFPLFLTVKNITNPVIAWAVDGYGDGTFEASAKSLQSGTSMLVVNQPALGATKMSDAETFMFISKDAFKTLVDTKGLTYNGVKFKLKIPAAAMKMNGKELDVINIISEDGKYEFWILNNPAFPLVMQSSGMGTDILVNEVK